MRIRTNSPSRQFLDLAADLQRVRDLMAATVLRCVWATAGPGVEDAWSRARSHLAAALREPSTRGRARLFRAMAHLTEDDPAAAEREIAAGLRDDPGDAELLHAQVELLLERSADASRPGEALRRAARTADQLCMVARYDLSRGQADSARSLVARGRHMKPRSSTCRQVHEQLVAAAPAG